MDVIILAGGLGTRLRSEVKDMPKCMAPVAGRPFLWYLLKYLANFRIVNRVILSVGYLSEVILDWASSIRNEFPFLLDYAFENVPLGTGGAIRLAMERVTEGEAVIINGDTYFDVDLDELISFHENHPEAKLTIALKPMRNFNRYGTVSIDGNGRVVKFNEKQACEAGNINGGIYVLSKDDGFFNDYHGKFSFETDIMPKKCGEDSCLFGVVQNGYFIDIGIPEDYHKADLDFSSMF